jgi:hypothetical protein
LEGKIPRVCYLVLDMDGEMTGGRMENDKDEQGVTDLSSLPLMLRRQVNISNWSFFLLPNFNPSSSFIPGSSDLFFLPQILNLFSHIEPSITPN